MPAPKSSSSHKLKLPVPTHILTGSLGAGKTTLLQHLLTLKPTTELWAILINEWGEVGIDKALVQSLQGPNNNTNNIAIKELAGGCLCCALGTVTHTAIVQLLRSSKPDRLLIEPSGLAHPAALLELLKGQYLVTAIDIQPVLCLVDITAFSLTALPQQLLSVADIVVATKVDIATQQQIQQFEEWAEQQQCEDSTEGRKYTVVCKSSSSLVTLADVGIHMEEENTTPSSGSGTITSGTAVIEGSSAPSTASTTNSSNIFELSTDMKEFLSLNNGIHTSTATSEVEPLPGQPQRVVNSSNVTEAGFSSCGWIFNSKDCFNKQLLLPLLQHLSSYTARVKGIFNTSIDTKTNNNSSSSSEWLAVSATQTNFNQWVTTHKTTDSRVEILLSLSLPFTYKEQEQEQQGNKDLEVSFKECCREVDSFSTTNVVDDDVKRAVEVAANGGDWQLVEKLLLACLTQQQQ